MYKKSGIFGSAVMWVLSTFLFTHSGLYFNVLSLNQGVKIMRAVYFVPQTVLVLALVYFTLMGTKSSRKPREGKTETKGEKVGEE